MVREIDDWADSPGNRHLCLLDGPAGFGKFAIARTVAQRWNVSKCLMGTFFFFRNLGDQSKGVRLVPTLSYQLTLFMPETRQLIENTLIKGPSLLDRPLEHQFQKLIIDPILMLPNLKLLGSPMRYRLLQIPCHFSLHQQERRVHPQDIRTLTVERWTLNWRVSPSNLHVRLSN